MIKSGAKAPNPQHPTTLFGSGMQQLFVEFVLLASSIFAVQRTDQLGMYMSPIQRYVICNYVVSVWNDYNQNSFRLSSFLLIRPSI